jgi:hypothetical protein
MEDVHFLARLERVERTQVELALSLYRDSSLVKFLLGHGGFPEGASRVAISLESETEGPFILVTREGNFVTCLGKGMRVKDLPVLSRQRLDEISNHFVGFKRSVEAAKRFTAESDAGQLFRKLRGTFEELSREEFSEMMLLEPVLAPLFRLIQYEIAKLSEKARDQLRGRVNLAKLPEVWLRSFESNLWALGHLSTLVGTNPDHDLLFGFLDHIKDETGYYSYHAVGKAITPVALRGIWTVGRLGERLLPTYLTLSANDDSWTHWLNGYLGCMMIALKTPKHKGEVRETFARVSQGKPDHPDPQKRDPWPAVYLEACDRLFERPEECLADQRQRGRAMALQRSAWLPNGSPYKFQAPEDVPDELAMPLAANALGCTLVDKDIIAAVNCLAWLSKAPAESLYFTTKYLKATRRPYSTENARRIARWFNEGLPKQTTIQVAPKPGRNELCSCSSGKKYKRCCGA